MLAFLYNIAVKTNVAKQYLLVMVVSHFSLRYPVSKNHWYSYIELIFWYPSGMSNLTAKFIFARTLFNYRRGECSWYGKEIGRSLWFPQRSVRQPSVIFFFSPALITWTNGFTSSIWYSGKLPVIFGRIKVKILLDCDLRKYCPTRSNYFSE